MMRRLLILAWVALAVTACAQRTPVNPVVGPVPVLDVVDGDTVVLDSNVGPRAVRLIGIDTPEVAHPERGREPFGPEATAFTASLLPEGARVWVEVDLEPEDAYGRLLAYLYRAQPDGGWRIDGQPAVMINEEIARGGFARVLTIAPNDVYADLFEAAVAEAQAEGRGMFGSPPDAADPVVDPVEERAVTGGGTAEAPDAGPYPIRIACILYNPSGDNDEAGEWVRLVVLGPVDTRGMALLDRGSGERFPLPVGAYDAGDTIVVGNPGQGVWNNGGDTVYLVIGSGNQEIDAWTYAPVPGQDRVVCR
jgi:micrococcal nuclease